MHFKNLLGDQTPFWLYHSKVKSTKKQPESRLERSAEMQRMAKLKMEQYDDVTKLTMNEKIDLIAEIWRHF